MQPVQMAQILPFITAALIAGVVTFLSISRNFPNTLFLVYRCKNIYTLCVVYAAIGFFCLVFFDVFYGIMLKQLVQKHIVQDLQKVKFNPWVQAVIVGLLTRPFMRLRLFRAKVKSKIIPIGTETLIQLFEPQLNRYITICHFNAVRNYIGPYVRKYSDISHVRKIISENIIVGIDTGDFMTILKDRKSTPAYIMDSYLRHFGRETFERVFPLYGNDNIV